MEMVESIAVMKYDSLGGLFDMRGIDIQLGIVCKQFAHLLKIAFPQENKSEEEWAQICEKKFKDGSVLKAFMSYLPEYKVLSDIVDTIANDPLTLLFGYVPMKILATRQGILKKLNQDGLGSFINFELATGVNPYLDNIQK